MSENNKTDVSGETGGFLSRLKRTLRFGAHGNEKAPQNDDGEQPVFSSLLKEGGLSEGDPKENSSHPSSEPEAKFVSTIWRLGRQDSGIGQASAQGEAVLCSKADLDWIDRRSEAKAAIHGKEARLLLVNTHKDRLEKAVEALKLQRWQLSGHPLLPASRGLSPMPVLYVLVGLLAFVAEFPLSVNLIDKGLRLSTAQLGTVSDQSMWALAVILCIFGLAAKICFDSATETIVMPQQSSSDEVTQQMKTAFRQRQRSKLLFLIVNVCLLVCCANSILSIARLRSAVAAQSRIESKLPNDGQFTEKQKDDLAAANATRENAGDKTMLWLTITLPLFGAVSWITGATKFKQNKEDRVAYQSLKSTEKELTKHSAEAASLEHEIASAKERLTEEDDGIVKAAVLKTRLDVYRHGYSRGRILPEERADGSFYDFSVKALRRLAHRKIRLHSTEAFSGND